MSHRFASIGSTLGQLFYFYEWQVLIKSMRTSHIHLLRLYHDPRYDFALVSVDYINRGAPGNRSTITGDGIHSLESGGMEIESAIGTTFIPYHRILKIQYDGNLVWERGKKMEEEKKKAPD